jgi:hypothetical protein
MQGQSQVNEQKDSKNDIGTPMQNEEKKWKDQE